MAQKSDRSLLEALMEGTEAALDLVADNPAVQAVPVVGTAFKLLKGVDDLRDRALREKLLRFLQEPSLREALKARALRKEILEELGRDQEIGEMLFLVLDNVTDMTKPVLLAKAYASYLDTQIDAFAFEAIAHAIHSAFLRDLEEFLSVNSSPDLSLWKPRLASVGLLEQIDEDWDGGQKEYQCTPLGESFLHAIAHAESLTPNH